ncbi:hypothetical protein WDW89_15425 [Deltaproteobacteria bacterium TL4]
MESSPPVSLRHRIEYAIFSVLKKLSLNASEFQLKIYRQTLYLLLFHVLRICRRIVRLNLEIAFPQYSEAEKKRIAKANYHWASRFTFDLLRLDHQKGKTGKSMQIKNSSILDDALAENKGILLVSGHLGQWEMIAPTLAEQGYPVTMYVGEQSNQLVDEHHNKVRQMFGIPTIGKAKSSALHLGRALSKNQMICMLVDQNNRKSGLFVDFFSKQASMSKGLALFYYLRQCPVVFVSCLYREDHLVMDFERINYAITGEKEQDLHGLSQAVSSVLEATIRQYPEQYFWMHRRWKTRPPEEQSPIY